MQNTSIHSQAAIVVKLLKAPRIDRPECIAARMNYVLFPLIVQVHFYYNGNSHIIFVNTLQSSSHVSCHIIILSPTVKSGFKKKEACFPFMLLEKESQIQI